MKLLDIVVKKAIIPTLSATDRDGAVNEIVDALAIGNAREDEDPLSGSILPRRIRCRSSSRRSTCK